MQKGDMQFVNDFSIMHARTAYRDDPQQRHVALPSSINLKAYMANKSVSDVT
jgi:hypothetical protein